jgi:hypothetical protein
MGKRRTERAYLFYTDTWILYKNIRGGFSQNRIPKHNMFIISKPTPKTMPNQQNKQDKEKSSPQKRFLY